MEYEKSYGRFEAKSNRSIVELEIYASGFGKEIMVYEKGNEFPTWFFNSYQSDCEMYEDDNVLIIYGDLGQIEIKKPFIRRVNDKILKEAKEYIEKNKEYRLVSLRKTELEDKLKEEVLAQTGINLDFDFKLAIDGELELYIKEHDFIIEEVKKLVDLDWIFEDVIKEWEPGLSPFQLDYELFVPSLLFNRIFKQVFGIQSSVIAIDNEINNIKIHILHKKR